ncbi:MAG: response regulator [Verrucomicrobiales bacterium]|nr:response regulator [Verrucomicrobiales bacterium]
MIKESSQLTGTILIVDDDQSVRQLLGQILKKAGNTVVATGCPLETLDLCEQHEPDAILLDVNMPEVSGIQICQDIRKKLPNIPIIMITGMTDNDTCQRTITQGATDFITKPFQAGEVLIRVKNAVQTNQLHLQLIRQAERFEQMMASFDKLDHEVHDIAVENGVEEKKHQVCQILADYVEEEPEDGTSFDDLYLEKRLI